MDAADHGRSAGKPILYRRYFKADLQPAEVVNSEDAFLLILPRVCGRLSLRRQGQVLFDGAVGPGTVRLVKPGERGALHVQTAYDQIVFRIPGSIFREQALLQGMSVSDLQLPSLSPIIHRHDEVRRLIPVINRSFEFDEARHNGFAQGGALMLMSLLLDPKLHQEQAEAPLANEAWFSRVCDFAGRRLDEHLSLSILAEVADLPLSEFARRFRDQTGVSPYAWIMDRRVAEAKKMIEGGASLVEAALASGFCSQSHFTEAFRLRVGASPGRWRKLQAR